MTQYVVVNFPECKLETTDHHGIKIEIRVKLWDKHVLRRVTVIYHVYLNSRLLFFNHLKIN